MNLTALSSSSLCASLFSQYPDIIRVAAFVAFFSFILIVITLIVIFCNRVRKVRKKEAIAKAENIIFEELSEHLLTYDTVTDIPEEEMNETVCKLNKLKNQDKVFRRTMVHLMVYFQMNMRGTVANIISSAYSRLKLREFTLGKLRSYFWFKKTQGLAEVQGMRDGHSLPEVQNLIDDSNQDVRVAAYNVLLKLKADNCFDFMVDEQGELSEWHQIMLEDAVVKTPGLEIPNFKIYLTTECKGIILLCIKLIVHYRQYNAVPKMLSMLDHEQEDVRNQIIEALGKLNSDSYEERLIERYPEETIKNKSAILIALGQSGSTLSGDFIMKKFLGAKNFDILENAAAAIISHPGRLKDSLTANMSQLDEKHQAILEHFEEPLNAYGSV